MIHDEAALVTYLDGIERAPFGYEHPSQGTVRNGSHGRGVARPTEFAQFARGRRCDDTDDASRPPFERAVWRLG
jgi:hypothetical protein